MSQEFDAIYERGVFRPLQRVALPEQAKVHLQVVETPSSSPASLSLEDETSTQKAALLELFGWIDHRPCPSGDKNFSVRDHDQILYGWQK